MEQSQTKQPLPQVPQVTTRPNYIIRLYSGRLNRQNYIVGSTFFVLVPLICFMVIIFNMLLSPTTFAMPYLDPNNPTNIITPKVSIVSLLQTPANELWAGIGIAFFIFSIPYLFSLQIRRLHDLNLTGWLWIVTFVPVISLFAIPLPDMNVNQNWLITANMISLIATLFTIYVTLWPGTKEKNKYGNPPLPRSSFLGDILQVK